MNKVFDYFDELFLNPVCELEYSKDYELLIAVMLSAQTTDKRVNKVTKVLFSKYPSLESLVKADVSDISDIIRELGSYRKKSVYVKEIAMSLLENWNGMVPNDRVFLESLSGVGRKTVNVFLGVIYNEPAIAVDTHVNRVSKRLGLSSLEDDVYEVEKKLMNLVPKERWVRTHHQLVLFGRYYCKAKNPLCDNCKLKKICKKNQQISDAF